MNRTCQYVFAVAFGMIAGCGSSVDPFPGIELRTEVSPAVVAVGDTVTIRAILRNLTSEDIETGRACGPPVLFELRHESGDVVHPIALDGAFTCPGLDYHQLEPFETDTVVTRWRVNLRLGQWSVRSGYRSGVRLEGLTPPVGLVVN